MTSSHAPIPTHVRSSAIFIAAAALAATTACRTADRDRAQEPQNAVSYTYSAADGSSARVTVARSSDGAEVLHGETAIQGRCIVEDVTIDARGRIAKAEIAIGAVCGGPADQRIVIDAAGRGDAPWIYAPPAAVATPVAAWVVARAAAAAPALRYLDPSSAHVPLVPRDQVAIETERGTTVIVGNDGADVDAVFVERVRMLDRGVTLVRQPPGGEPSAASPAVSRRRS